MLLIIKYILIVVLVGGLMSYLSRASGKRIETAQNGSMILRVSKEYFVLGICAIFFSLGILVFALTGVVKTIEDLLVVTGIFSFFYLGGIYFIALKYHYIEVTEEKITSFSFWRKPISLKWEDIVRVSFDERTLYLKLSDTSNCVRVHEHMTGFSRFKDIALEKIDREVVITGWPVWMNAARKDYTEFFKHHK